MSTEEILNQQFNWIEEQFLRDELKDRAKHINHHKLFLKAYLVKAIAVYLTAKTDNQETEYTLRIKGMCQMLLFICDEFGYLDKQQVANYKKILYK